MAKIQAGAKSGGEETLKLGAVALALAGCVGLAVTHLMEWRKGAGVGDNLVQAVLPWLPVAGVVMGVLSYVGARGKAAVDRAACERCDSAYRLAMLSAAALGGLSAILGLGAALAKKEPALRSFLLAAPARSDLLLGADAGLVEELTGVPMASGVLGLVVALAAVIALMAPPSLLLPKVKKGDKAKKGGKKGGRP